MKIFSETVAICLSGMLLVSFLLPDAHAEKAFLAVDFQTSPYDLQVAEQIAKLQSQSHKVRAGAAEALGYLRAYTAADVLADTLGDRSEIVRREAAMALAWRGGRNHVRLLLLALDDEDWVVRQAASVALTNLTAMEFPFDALAKPGVRKKQAAAWRAWWIKTGQNLPADEIVSLAGGDDANARLRAIRSLGALGGSGAGKVIANVITPYRDKNYRKLSSIEKNIVQSGLRCLGRLRQPEAFEVLIAFFNTQGWARYAADALADFGDARAVKPLIAAYPRFSRNLQNRTKNPQVCPSDDRFSGDNTQDRMHETPYSIAMALSRLPLDNADDKAELRRITPWLVANLPTSWDSGVFYDIEAAQLVTAYLLEKAGTRQKVCDIAFDAVQHLDRKGPAITGQEKTIEETLAKLALRMYGDVPDIATWLPAFCRADDVERLIGLLEHDDGWIRINTAKALMFIGDRRAIEPLAKLLSESKTEAEWGYSGALEHAEYNDPAPRWREAYIRAIGRLGAKKYDRLLVSILEDRRNVMDIHHAAAIALDELGTPLALQALKRADRNHPFHSVRLVAREALSRRGIFEPRQIEPMPTLAKSTHLSPDLTFSPESSQPEAIVFIKGNKRMRSDFNGQAGVDPWR